MSFYKKTNKPWLTWKKQVNLFDQYHISSSKHSPQIFNFEVLKCGPIISKWVEIFKRNFKILSFLKAINNHLCSLLNSRGAGYFHYFIVCILVSHVVGNKAKGQIPKQVFQENKACQIFRKTNISYPSWNTRF